LSVKDSSGAELANDGTSIVSGDQDVYVDINPGTDYNYTFNGVDVYYQGEEGNPSGSYFDGPTVPDAYVTSIVSLSDTAVKPVPSDGKISVPVVQGQPTVLYVTASRNGAVTEVFKHTFSRGYLTATLDNGVISATGALEPGQKGQLIFAVYKAGGALVTLEASDEFTGTTVKSFDASAYPLEQYTYKVFCWNEFVPLYDAVSIS
jgi:hypothetical protein